MAFFVDRITDAAQALLTAETLREPGADDAPYPRANAGTFEFWSDLRNASTRSLSAVDPTWHKRRTVVMKLNPNAVTWKQAKRSATQRTRDFNQFYFHQNDAGQALDVLVLEIKGSSGAIAGPLPSDGSASGTLGYIDPHAESKLRTWRDFLALSREPECFKKLVGGKLQLRANTKYLWYSSPLFPVTLLMTGHFEAPLAFSEEADKPFSRDYSVNFVVTDVHNDFAVGALKPLDLLGQLYRSV